MDHPKIILCLVLDFQGICFIRFFHQIRPLVDLMTIKSIPIWIPSIVAELINAKGEQYIVDFQIVVTTRISIFLEDR